MTAPGAAEASPGALAAGGGAWKRQKMRGGPGAVLAFRALAWTGRPGLALLPLILAATASLYLIVDGAARRASLALARRVGRGRSALGRLAFVWRHFFRFGQLLTDRLVLLVGRRDLFRIEVEGEAEIARAAAQGKGVVLLAAHLGNWEAMGQLLGPRLGLPVTVVMSDAMSHASQADRRAMEAGRSFQVIYADGSPASAAAVLQALREGRLVGMMGDRVNEGRAADVPFLGGTARLPLGPFALARAAGAPLLFVSALRTGTRRYRFQAVAAPDLGGPRDAALQRGAAAFAALLDEQVRAHPEQWGNFFPFCREDQPGAGAGG